MNFKRKYLKINALTIMLSLLSFVFQINAMRPTKVPYAITERMKKSSISPSTLKMVSEREHPRQKQLRQEQENKEQLELEEERFRVKKEQGEREQLNRLSQGLEGDFNNVYLYDKSGQLLQVWQKDIWRKSKFLKNLIFIGEEKTEEEVSKNDFLSKPLIVDFSKNVVIMFHDLLEKCPSSEKREECEDVIKKDVQSFDFNTSASLLSFASFLDVNKGIINPFIEKIQKKTNAFFDGDQQLTDNNMQLLRSMDRNLLNEIIGTKWNVFLEKMKLFLIKNKKIDSVPKLYLYGSGSSGVEVKSAAFSPDDNRILIATDQYNESTPLDKEWIYVLKRDGSFYQKLEDKIYETAIIWINKDKFACIDNRLSMFKVFDCAIEKVITIPLPNNSIKYLYHDMTLDNKRVLFYYKDHQNKFVIGIYDDQKPETIDYKLFDLPNFLISRLFSLGRDEIFFMGRFNDQSENKIYKLKSGSNKLIEIAELFDEETFPDEMVTSWSPGSKKFSAVVLKLRLGPRMGDKERVVDHIVIYSFETKQKIKCVCDEKIVYTLKFSSDGKMLIAGCKNKLLIFSAITGEKIGEFTHKDGQAFEKNFSVALSSDENTLVVGSEVISGFLSSSPNLLIWKFMTDSYVSAFKSLEYKILSFDQVNFFVSLFNNLQSGQKPGKLTDAQVRIFHTFDDDVQKMLTDIKCVASGQIGIHPNDLWASEVLQSQKSNWWASESQGSGWLQKLQNAGIMARDFWNYIMRLPDLGEIR